MTFEQTRLTQLEETTALVQAGIDPEMGNWNDATLTRAAEVLEAAQQAKIERLTVHKEKR